MPHVLHTIWLDSHEPTNKDTLWIKPLKKDYYGIFVYGSNGWTLTTALFKGTIGEFVVDQLPEATTESNGVMSAQDKTDLEMLKASWADIDIIIEAINNMDASPTSGSTKPVTSGGVKEALDGKQDALVSGTNIKTINGESLLGSGDIEVAAESIDTVEVSVDSNTGTPSATASVSGSTLNLAFHNIKGETGATGATGPRGYTPVLTADEDGTIYADGILLTEVVKDVTEAVESAERSRVTAESQRVAAESARVSAEQGRATAETARQTAEGNRATAETERASAEGARATAEQGRVSAEQGRVSAESGRVSAESERVAAETARESASATAVSNAETATQAANTAAEHAEEAAATIDDKIAGKADQSEVNQLSQEINKTIRDNQDSDFSISDGNGYSIAQFKNGHINTKNFDSSKVGTEVETEENYDFGVKDEDNNILVMLKNGGIKTKNFDSETLPNMSDVVDRYKGKRFSLLGDSISTFGTPSATNEDGTYCYSYYPSASCRYSEDGVDSIAFDVNNTYWMKLIKRTGMVLGINDSYRGTMVSGASNAFNLQTRIDHLGENGTPDVILVYGGTNDAGNNVELGTFNTENPQNYTDAQIAALSVSTFADAYRAMLIRLMKTYPLAEIIVVLPTFTTSYYTITNLDLYVEIIKEACDFFGIKYIDARCTGINVYNRASFLVDGIHPNAAGMDLLFKKIYRQLIFN